MSMTKQQTLARLDALRAAVAALPNDVEVLSAEVPCYCRTGHECDGTIHLYHGDGKHSTLDAAALALGVEVDPKTEENSGLWRFAHTPDRIELFEIIYKPARGEALA